MTALFLSYIEQSPPLWYSLGEIIFLMLFSYDPLGPSGYFCMLFYSYQNQYICPNQQFSTKNINKFTKYMLKALIKKKTENIRQSISKTSLSFSNSLNLCM